MVNQRAHSGAVRVVLLVHQFRTDVADDARYVTNMRDWNNWVYKPWWG